MLSPMPPSLSIGERITSLRQSLPEGVRLVAVSKFHPSEAIVEAYEAGQRIFGESRVQELVAKNEELGQLYLDLVWHFIGPLQTNKVKYIAPFVHMIESVSSERLLAEINKQALKHQRRIDILLEIHLAQEESKSGFTEEEALELLATIKQAPELYRGIRLRGLMTMASNTEDAVRVEGEFARLNKLMRQIHEEGLVLGAEDFDELSMGMSGDYPLALRQGATLVRIGSAIFGERD